MRVAKFLGPLHGRESPDPNRGPDHEVRRRAGDLTAGCEPLAAHQSTVTETRGERAASTRQGVARGGRADERAIQYVQPERTLRPVQPRGGSGCLARRGPRHSRPPISGCSWRRAPDPTTHHRNSTPLVLDTGGADPKGARRELIVVARDPVEVTAADIPAGADERIKHGNKVIPHTQLPARCTGMQDGSPAYLAFWGTPSQCRQQRGVDSCDPRVGVVVDTLLNDRSRRDTCT